MSAAAACALVVALALGPQRAVRVADVELRGPLDGATLALPGGGETRLEGRLAEGERRTLAAPVLLPRGAADAGASEIEAAPGGVRVLRWSGAPSWEAWTALPAGLRLRSRPPAGAAVRAPSAAVLLALAAGATLATALRRRPLGALAAGLASTAAAILAPLASVGPGAVRVLEGDGASGRWIAVDAAAGELELGERRPLALFTEPEDAALALAVSLADGGRVARAPGAGLTRVEALEPGPRRLAADGNRWGSFAVCWVRDVSGTWTWRGPWPLGRPLPPAAPGEPPPGWLASSLPQGVPVLVARLEGGFGAAPPSTPTWLRLVGF